MECRSNKERPRGGMRTFLVLTGVLTASLSLPAIRLADVPAVPVSEYTRSWWLPRFEEKRALAEKEDFPVVFIGDSIVHNWEAGPGTKGRGKDVWPRYFAEGPYRALNAGFGGDRTEHVLWRLDHGLFGRTNPKAVVLMIGTNNTGHFGVEDEPPGDTFAGISAIVGRIRRLRPEAKVILHPIFPCGQDATDGARRRNDRVNELLPRLCDGKNVVWCDLSSLFVDGKGRMIDGLTADLLHPTAAGYELWAKNVIPFLDWALGRRADLPKSLPAAFRAPRHAPELPKAARAAFDGNISRTVEKRHEILRNESGYFDAVFIGDSITFNWDAGRPGEKVLKSAFPGWRILNAGFSAYSTQGIIWNCECGGLLDGYRTRCVMVMAGTNNATKDPPEDVARAVKRIVDYVRLKQPAAKVVLMALLPRDEPGHPRRIANEKANALIRRFADGKDVIWCDIGARFVSADGTVKKALMPDCLHPSEEGHRLWAEDVGPVLRQACGRK